MRAGVAVTGVSPLATDSELNAQLDDAGVKLVVTHGAMASRARDAVIVDELLQRAGRCPRRPPRPRLLPYSSSTTSLPKGVVITPATSSTAVRQFQAGLRLGERDTLIAVAPFAHIMGFVPNLAVPLVASAGR